MKIRKINLKSVSILLLIIIIILVIVLFIVSKKKDNNHIEYNDNKIKESKEEYKLSLIMAGDALINDLLYTDAYKNGVYDFKPYLRLIKEKVKDYDLAYYNQETILGGTGIGLSSYPSFNSPFEVGDAMIDAGFNLVSLATNHTMDRGEEAIKLSRDYWNSIDNVYAFGSYNSFEEKKNIESKILDINHIKCGILNYTYGTNGINVPSDKSYLVNLWSNLGDDYKDTVLRDINNLRDKVDVLIVAMHWGIEYTHKETDKQREIAAFLAQNGVDIIIGTHPHVVEPVEWIDNTLVFYSLGNFISSQTSESCTNYKCNIGLLSSLNITKTIENDKTSIKIDNIENELIYTYHNNYHDYLVIPFSNKEIKEYLNNYIDIYNKYAGIIKTNDDKMVVVPLTS